MRKIQPSIITRLFQRLLTGGAKNLPTTAYEIRTTG
jgi:hypothetical protein